MMSTTQVVVSMMRAGSIENEKERELELGERDWL